ncbi:putative Methylglutaconyl-CoA hydratase [[Clostridium] ultunense Esp]|nr:putative Methylglutaconyl-CoA hydratase [[Clostridium] ultunense Esp]
MPLVLYEERGTIAVLTLNRPEVHHALNREILLELREAFNRLERKGSIRAAVITGSGSDSFSAGADLKERAAMTEEEVARFIPFIRDTFTLIERLPQPVIAAINGRALGGGMELALACDVRILSERAVMGLKETTLGIIPGAGGTQRLPRLIGIPKAKELILTGRTITASEALAIGLVNQVVPPEEVLSTALKWAEEISANGPIAVKQAKWAINHGMKTDLDTGLELETSAYRLLIPTNDRREGLHAFREKRKPNFTGE